MNDDDDWEVDDDRQDEDASWDDAPAELGDESTEVTPCPACGQEVYEDAEQCPYCGDYIIAGSGDDSRRTIWFHIAWLLALLVVLSWILASLL